MISVTQVLGLYADFSIVHPNILELAAQRGTAVHSFCAAYSKGLWVPQVPDSMTGYFASFKQWFDLTVKEVLFVEKELRDDIFLFQGHPDAVVRLKHEEGLFLYDIKTPVIKSRLWNSQLAAYKWLAEKHLKKEIKKCFVLQLSPKGKMAKVTYSDNTLNDFNMFLQALATYRWFKNET